MVQQVNGDIGTLVLVGGCTLRTAEDTHAALLAMAASHAAFEIDCSEVEEVDLSFIQLLLAARAPGNRAGRSGWRSLLPVRCMTRFCAAAFWRASMGAKPIGHFG